MKIYTKRGDEGFTDLFGGMRVSKNTLQVKAYGLIDATNSALGMAASISEGAIKQDLIFLMNLLFCAGSEVSCAKKQSSLEVLHKHLKIIIDKDHILYMENRIDEMEKELTPLKNFILPGGSELACRLHWARSMTRITEISLVELKEIESSPRSEIIIFFNRLSDFLFVMARFANHKKNIKDEEWSGHLFLNPPTAVPE